MNALRVVKAGVEARAKPDFKDGPARGGYQLAALVREQVRSAGEVDQSWQNLPIVESHDGLSRIAGSSVGEPHEELLVRIFESFESLEAVEGYPQIRSFTFALRESLGGYVNMQLGVPTIFLRHAKAVA